MPSMVTGDQKGPGFGGPDMPNEDELEAALLDAAAEQEPVQCICKWQHIDSGTQFYSRIVQPHPSCPAHQHR